MNTVVIKTTPERGSFVRVTFPTRDDIQNLKVGDMAPNSFGDENRVTRIYAQQDNIHGRAFVCYYTQFGDNAEISSSLEEAKIHRSVDLSHRFTSAQLDELDGKLELRPLSPGSVSRVKATA